MRTSSARRVGLDDVYSIDEIARAAGVRAREVVERLPPARAGAQPRYVSRRDAIRLVRALSATADDRAPLTIFASRRRRQTVPLLLSGALHLALLAIFLLASSAMFGQRSTEQAIAPLPHERLVFLVEPGPGGGGGGGGLKTPEPPAPARQQAPKVQHFSSPVRLAPRPPPRPRVPDPPKPPPIPIEPPRTVRPRPEPPRPELPRVAPPVQALVAPRPADNVATAGVLDVVPRPASAGPGEGGGAGTGSGSGLGSGRGAGLGPGIDAGVGGGPFKPGTDIQPPTLLREVKPVYTDEARKRSIQGAVLLDAIVRRDGSVGDVQVVRSLGAGLDERAREAVLQWRFAPAQRRGVAVDVQVQISVQFELR